TPSVRVFPLQTTTNESSSVALKCEVEGKPQPTVKWFKNGFPVHTNDSRITSTIAGSYERLNVSLMILNVSRFDEGVYRCQAYNGIGENVFSTGANLTVHYPPKISASPQNVTEIEHQSVTFYCTVQGKPIQITWWYSDVNWINTSDSDKYSVSWPSSESSSEVSLTINSLVRGDEGTYRCKAENNLGTEYSQPAYLTVYYSPKILTSPSGVTKREEENVTLSCRFEGKPIPRVVEWFTNGQKLAINSNSRLTVSDSRNTSSTTSSLTITNLNRTDEGNYICVISNIVKTNVTSTAAKLTVHYPPFIALSPHHTTTKESSHVTLKCHVKGNPTPTVKWFKNGFSVGTNDSRITSAIAESYEDPSKISASPKNVTKIEHQSVIFNCTVQGKPISQITWWYSNGKINTSDSAKYSVSGHSSASSCEVSLTINSLVRSDEGTYRCKAENSLGTEYSQPAYLTVYYPTKILTSPSGITKTEGANVAFFCRFEGKPIPTMVEWFANGQKLAINSNSRLTVRQSGDSSNVTSWLTITNLNRADKGNYTCVIGNSVKSNVISSAAQLTIHYPPFVRFSPLHTTINESSTVTLKCEVEGKPQPTVKWFKNGFPVDKNDSRITSPIAGSKERVNASLMIQNVGRFDEGVYKCHAYNGIGENVLSTRANLTVHYPPKISASPQNVTEIEHQSVTFYCTVQGKPIQITWWYSGVKINASNGFKYRASWPSSESSSEVSLTIKSLVRGDEGTYRCKAENNLGTEYSQPGYLTVFYPPKILTSPSGITKTEGENVTLSCRFEGKPLPRMVEWSANGQKLAINSNSRLTVNESEDSGGVTSSLTITKLNRTDNGNYTCVIGNSVKSNVTSSAAQLTVNCK
ncbi:Hemicentin-1, partial [Exaiptasia diaphana]